VACASFPLTVSASKRLIAKAVAQLPCVRHALAHGIVAIGKGTTNGYVVEEILGRPIDKRQYVLGTTQPTVGRKPMTDQRMPDVILERGTVVEGTSVVDVIAQMGEGDVLIKGANALSADRKVAGILVGDPQGGTWGKTWGRTGGAFVTRVIPVGLEKVIAGDVLSAAATLQSGTGRRGATPNLMPVQGVIVTEIEAIGVLCGADATQIGAGGINGAEGAVWLFVEGDDDAVGRARELVEAIGGEPPFVP